MEDMLEITDEIQETLGRSYGMPDLDEADLDAGNFWRINSHIFHQQKTALSSTVGRYIFFRDSIACRTRSNIYKNDSFYTMRRLIPARPFCFVNAI